MTLTSFSPAFVASIASKQLQTSTKFTAQQNRLSQSSGDSIHFSGAVAKPSFDYNSERNSLILSGTIELSELSDEKLALIENANYINIDGAKIAGETLKTTGSISISGASRLDVDNVEAGGEFSLHEGTVNGNVKSAEEAYNFDTITGNLEVGGTQAGVWGTVGGDVILTANKGFVAVNLDGDSERFIPNIAGAIRFPNMQEGEEGVVLRNQHIPTSEFSNLIENGRLIEKAEWDNLTRKEGQELVALWSSKPKGLFS